MRCIQETNLVAPVLQSGTHARLDDFFWEQHFDQGHVVVDLPLMVAESGTVGAQLAACTLRAAAIDGDTVLAMSVLEGMDDTVDVAFLAAVATLRTPAVCLGMFLPPFSKDLLVSGVTCIPIARFLEPQGFMLPGGKHIVECHDKRSADWEC